MPKKKSKHSKKPTAAAVSAIAATTASSDDILVKDPTQDSSDPTATATISYKVDSPPSDQVRVDDNTQAVDHTTHNNDSAGNSFTPKDHESHTDHTQEAWSSSLPEGNGKTPDHNDSSTTKDDLHYHEDQQLPIERAAPRQYEDDDDYEDGHARNDNEHSPLIRENSHDSNGYGSGEDSRERREVETRNDNEPTTWIEWSLKQGLHPRTWNRQTYIKFGLLVTLVTLVVLSLTVFRIQDHIKDILQ
ncbi:hypothetical protein BGZ49_003170 [Haplosporangium sp. Z 27]|nr:hypothetical protein BGZ49_003170 [Haplosporangium sp. Z 27]